MAYDQDYIQGIDISHWQGEVDHAQAAASGMRFCVCKATEGRTHTDDRFAEYIAGIREVQSSGGIYYPGAYHFARPDTDGGNEQDGAAEGEHFCDVVQEICGEIVLDFMPPALDWEKYSDFDEEENIPWIDAWIDVVERRLNRRPMIYTGKNVWKYECGNTDKFSDYPLWQVYYSGTATQPPEMPWPGWAIWQWSGSDSMQYAPDVPGVGVCDVNRWNGNLDELKVFANAGGEPPPPTPNTWPTPPAQINLNDLRGSYSGYVARVQGLLLSYGYGPDGLVSSSTGRPDGLMGNKTQDSLVDFKVNRKLPGDTVMDWATWWALSYGNIS
ncbi:MAG TPA: glycoside hydrolase family 25 protein [Armatimonadota bacterium]|nr:glycoside hydrolase family 25 protein [Armatimonadota bacterium]